MVAAPRRLAALAVAGTLGAGLGACGGGQSDEAERPTSPGVELPRLVGVDTSEYVDAVGFDRNGGALVVAGNEVRSLRPDGALGDVVVPKATGTAIGFSPDGSLVLRQDQTEFIAQSATAPFRVKWRAEIPYSQYDDPRDYWSADGQRVLVNTDGGRLVFDARSGRRVANLPTGTYYLGAQPLSPGGKELVDTTEQLVRIRTVAGGKVRTLAERGGSDATWSPDGRTIATGRGGLTLIEVSSGSERSVELPITPSQLEAIHWAPDSKRLAVVGSAVRGDSDALSIAIVDAQSGRSAVATTVERSAEEVEPIAWSSDSAQLAFHRSDDDGPGGGPPATP